MRREDALPDHGVESGAGSFRRKIDVAGGMRPAIAGDLAAHPHEAEAVLDRALERARQLGDGKLRRVGAGGLADSAHVMTDAGDATAGPERGREGNVGKGVESRRCERATQTAASRPFCSSSRFRIALKQTFPNAPSRHDWLPEAASARSPRVGRQWKKSTRIPHPTNRLNSARGSHHILFDWPRSLSFRISRNLCKLGD